LRSEAVYKSKAVPQQAYLLPFPLEIQPQWKKCWGDANTARSCRHRLLPWGVGRPTFNQLEMVTTFTYRPSLVKIDASNS